LAFEKETEMKAFALLALMGVLAAAPALAQDHAGMAGMEMGTMLGQHMMPVTVTAIDSKTGLVDATAGSMALKLHFPPPSLAGIKPGDKIMVHLAFHKS
jgi:hypothetical protein